MFNKEWLDACQETRMASNYVEKEIRSSLL